ncbi:hypothetical protein [Paenibacillus lutrae]|uniref:DUF5673 domain-containing protein n=1 Tax=Paenibacillus lutrae TaxID=2078573 RepID=A0A7X3JZU5_9BACL|nr:hypothetical protein [Paenibacillus lutrae]MVP00291.1 hypothetical protein [Paenibacillus lutrae]
MFIHVIIGLIAGSVIFLKLFQSVQAKKHVGFVYAQGNVRKMSWTLALAYLAMLFTFGGNEWLLIIISAVSLLHLNHSDHFYLGENGLCIARYFYAKDKLISYEITEGDHGEIRIIVAGIMEPVTLNFSDMEHKKELEMQVSYYFRDVCIPAK